MPPIQADDDPVGPRELKAAESAGPGGRLYCFTHFDEWIVQRTLSSRLHVFCDWHIHPNAITGLSLAMAAAIPFLHYSHLSWWVAVSIVVRQILDCLDGEVARRCHKTSKAGALLDAIGDTVFYFALIMLLMSFFLRNPLRVLFFSGLAFGCLFAVHVSICKGAALIEHSAVKSYDSPSLYRRSYAFLINNSLVFAACAAVLYRLSVR